MKKYITSIMLLILLTGCISSVKHDSDSSNIDLPVVRYVNFKVYDPVYVALDKGFFESNGVQVEIIGDVLAGPTAIQAVASGSAEAGLSSVPALINANAAGLPVQGVVDIQTTLPGQALQKWYVRTDSNIETLEDVKGHIYAVNLWRSSFHYTSLLALNQRNIDENSVTWVLLSFDKQIPALAEGEVDVIGLMEPYQTFAKFEYKDSFRELFNDYDDVYGTRHVSLIFVNRVWAEYNPNAVRGFVAGIVDAIDWIESHQSEAKNIIARYTGIPEHAVPEYHFTKHGQIHIEDVEIWMRYLQERGDLTADWLTADFVATDEYNPKSNQ